ncbi:hypothetical protein NZK33_12685 [Cyanobium sp. FGCU-6]|nr:hypothetical protein [Cyanobium sp. FGCU6]
MTIPSPDLPGAVPPQRRFLGLDNQGIVQVLAGIVVGLIALFSSYDHIALPGRVVPLQRQWGIGLILISFAVFFIDAQLATRARDRAANERAEERVREDQERDRAAEARERQAQAAERQRQGIALLRSTALLSARFQLDPSDANRSSLNALLPLMAAQAADDAT